jgi:hypothetical protein
MKLFSILNNAHDPTTLSSLDTMDLGPTKNTENPVMVSFSHVATDEVPTLRTDPILYLGLQTPSTELVGLF